MHAPQNTVFRYALALVSVAFTLGVALLTWHYGIRHQFSMFLIVVAVIAWYCRAGPAVLAVISSLVAYDYFFREPAYTFSVSPGDIPNYVLTVMFTLLVVWFGTVRHRTEDALRSSEKKYRELIDAAPDAIFVFDGHGKWVLANAAAAKLRGCTENELMELSLADTYVPSERNLVQERLERVKKLGVLRYERQFLRKNNEIVPVEVAMSTAGEDQFQSVARDISERKKAEEILRERANLLDLTHDTIFVRNMNNVITYWNRGAEESYGWTVQDAVGQVSYELLRTIFPEPLDDINAKLLCSGRWEGELVHTTRNGARLVVASRWSLQRDERGNPSAILETNNDITDRKQAEEALQKTQTELAHVARLTTMGELTSSIAHEVNQPLTAIVTSGNACLRWLSNDPPNVDEARELVSRIVKDGYRASDVVQRIGGFFQKVAPEKVRLEINHLIKDVIAMVPVELSRNRVQLRTEVPVDLPPVIGDPIQLQQVLLNLVINSIEAMSKVDGPRELLIKSQQYESDSVLVTVQDTGTGFDEQKVDQLFEAFYTTKSNGLGLGLSISRTTIEAYGGRLWATTNNGNGATFQFTLPAKFSKL